MSQKLIIQFKEALNKITDEKDFIKAHYLTARNDEIRQQIIDGINKGLIKNKDDIRKITVKMSPIYPHVVNNPNYYICLWNQGKEIDIGMDLIIEHITPDFIYCVENHGYNNYLFIDKIANELIEELD